MRLRMLTIYFLFSVFIVLCENKKIMRTVEGSLREINKRITLVKDLTYHKNGVVAKNSTVVSIIWNNGANIDGGVKTCFSQIPTFFNALSKTKAITDYLPGVKNTDPQGKMVGVDPVLHFLTPIKRATSLSDKEITDELITWMAKKYDQKYPNSTIPSDKRQPLNYIYMVFFPKGTILKSGSCKKYCAFHSSFFYSNVRYVYAAIPWPGDCPKSCSLGIYNTNSSGLVGDDSILCGALNSIAFHELTETITDPYSNAYYDSNGQENADKCIWKSPPGCFISNQTNYCIQPIWNHRPKNSKDPKSNDIGCVNDY